MIELLAVIVILGIVSTIGIVAVTRLVDSSKKNYYESQQSQLVLAARAYAGDHREELPRNIGEKNPITLKKLYDTKYLKDEIVDKDKNPCDPVKSYVNVVKTSKSDYAYRGYLNCKSCEDKSGYCYKETDINNPPTIVITLPNNKDNDLFNESKTIDFLMNANGDNAKVSSYSYKIFVNNALRFNSGTKINGKRETVEVHEPIYKYLPGNVKVVATITNSDGDTRSYSKSQDYSDAHEPSCGGIKYDGSNTMGAYKTGDDVKCGTSKYKWINNGKRHVWVECNDLKGIGCSQMEFSKVLESEGATDKVVVKDSNGKTHDCYVLNCIDKTTPKIVVKIYKAKSNGTKDGNATKTFTVNSQKGKTSYTQNDTYNTWINGINYPNGVIVEVTTNDTSDISNGTSEVKTIKWYQNAVNQKEKSIGAIDQKVDENNNINKKTYTKSQFIKNDGVRKQVITVKDNAGNVVTYNLILKIDRTAPPKPTVSLYLENSDTSTSTSTKYTSNTWKNKYVWVNTNHPIDKPDVSEWKTNQYTTTGVHGSNSNKNGNDVHINKEGTSTIKFRSCDNAGNCSLYTNNSTIKLDRTIKVPSTKLFKWKNNNTTPTSSSGLSSYSDNTWYSGKVFTYPTGSEETGDVSGLKEYQYTTTGKTSNKTNQSSKYRNIEAQGTSYIKWRAVDNAGNISKYNSSSTVKLDRTAPPVPTTNMKKWSSNNEPSSPNGLSNYSNNTWLSGRVYTYPSGSNETGDVSGLKEYQYTTTGTTSNKSNKAASERNIKAEGTSYIIWRACDNADNCTAYNAKSTIKLDRTNPIAKYSISGDTIGSGYANGAVIDRSCTDPGEYASGIVSKPTRITLGGGGTKDYSFVCKDRAGNTDEINGSYDYSPDSICGTYQCDPYNCNPYNCNCKTTQVRHFGCYSSSQSGKDCYRSSNLDGSCNWECVWYTNKQTCSTCYKTCYKTCNKTCWH